MDVFIIEEHRGKGYSSILIEKIMTEPELKKIKIWRLATSDAHFLYKKFGFTSLENPEKMMEKMIRG
jgi:GNAT superfamily N-acetyltransferase